MTTYLRPAIFALAGLMFAVLVWFSLASYSPVPLVDGWPVYSRLMDYILGEIDLKTYLLAPHGSHPHAIVYALYRIDLHYGGRQIVPHLANVAATAAMAVVMAWWVRRAIAERGSAVVADFGGMAALIAVSTLSIEMLSPFQVVLSASRLVFCVLLVAFVWTLRRGNAALDLALLAISCLAITFHGSGLLFGIVVLAQHLLFSRSWLQRLAGAAPMLASILYSRIWLPPGAGEMAGVSQWLAGFRPGYVLDLAVSTFAYYAVPLVPVWRDPADGAWLIAFGGVLAIVTTVWALVAIGRMRASSTATLGLAFIAIFVALSAASAALVWESRQVLGFPGEPEMNVMHSARYAAGALLAYALIVVPVLSAPMRFTRGAVSAVVVLAAVLLFSNVATYREREALTDVLDEAATALFAGAEVTDSPAGAVWPEVAQDWYWPTQLRKVMAFAKDRRIGFAYGLPSLGSDVGALWQSAVQTTSVGTTSVFGVCSIAGTIPPIERNLFSAPHFLAVTDADGKVIGAVAVPVATDETRVEGYIRCPAGPTTVVEPKVVESDGAVIR